MLAAVACGDDAAPVDEARDAGVRRDAAVQQVSDAGRALDARVEDARDAARDSAMSQGDARVEDAASAEVDAGERTSGLRCDAGLALVSIDGASPRSFQIGKGVRLPLYGIDGTGLGIALDYKSLLGYWAQPMPDGTVDGPAVASLLALDATREGPGELLCSGEGSGWVSTKPDMQAEIVLHDVASLGTCAGGTPLAGSITLCTGFQCDLQGTLDGHELWASYGGLRGSTEIGAMYFTASMDRSADVATVLYGSYEKDEQNPFPWALLQMSGLSPYPDALICARKVVASSSAIINTTMTLTDFRLLGACPSGGTKTVRACALGQRSTP